MQEYLKKTNALYMIAAVGLLAANILSALLAVIAPEFVQRFSIELSGLLEILVVGLPAAILLSREQYAPFRLRFSRKSVGYHLITILPMAIGGFFFFTGLNGFVTYLFSLTGLNVDNSVAQIVTGETSLWMLFLCIAVIPGVVEEMLLRGFVMPGFSHLGKVRAILLSAFLFAFLHGQPIAFLVQLLLGILLGCLCWESRSIYPGMIYHILHNGFTVLVLAIMNFAEQYIQFPEEMMADVALDAQSLGAMLPAYLMMTAIGGVVLLICLIFFHQLCAQDRTEQVRKGLYADEKVQSNLLPGTADEHPWMPLWIGLAASVLINILGLIAQFAL